MKAIIFDFNRTLYNPESKGLVENAVACLKKLSKEYILFLVVKGGEERKNLIHSLNIDRFFKFISVEEEKSINQFKECQSKLNPNTKWFVVGDRIRREIRFGNQCDMKTIWLKSGKFASEGPRKDIERPDVIIHEFEEILEVIKN